MFKLMNGENSYNQATLLGKFIYFCYSFFMVIVTLNLLISILSNTYEKELNKKHSKDLRQLCEILIEEGQFSAILRMLARPFRCLFCKDADQKKDVQEYQHSYLHMFSEIRFSAK